MYHKLKLLEVEQDNAESSRHPKRSRTYIIRDRELAHDRLWNNYFNEHPIYPPNIFQRRFQMRNELLLLIVYGICNHSGFFFQQRFDGLGKKRYFLFTKMHNCHMLVTIWHIDWSFWWMLTNWWNNMNRLHKIFRCLIEVYSNHYMRKVNANDIQKLLQKHSEKHGFLVMLGSIDCMHWPCKNCLIGKVNLLWVIKGVQQLC